MALARAVAVACFACCRQEDAQQAGFDDALLLIVLVPAIVLTLRHRRIKNLRRDA